MARVREFCAANIARLVLSIVILVGLLFGLGIWMFYSAGNGRLVDQHPQAIVPAK
ncbi:hypothetical protein ACPOL_0262 [Acidisarcina polymorpha]|uniref:Uncharacterized protein n=1 Tax=Acidisarcina polymorpha TaxID=2211140 RepID=A0A2Z5FT32_9BACT|nr:hypothetical protein [Acidisarcina polymorpha]AXC09647.1 hypothetical protein ACPOL_0262 [Acidisarcina polymorpha]